MVGKMIIRNHKEEVEFFELVLETKFPLPYRTFLIERGEAIVRGFRILGIPARQKGFSVLDTTQLLRNSRKDLKDRDKLIVISIDGDRALCLDLREEPINDAPLVEVSLLEQGTPVLEYHKTFAQWIKEGEAEDKRFLAAKRRIENRRTEIKERIIRRIVGSRYRSTCPICEKRTRGSFLVCSYCFGLWRRKNQQSEIELADWVQQEIEKRGVRVPKFTHKGKEQHIRIRAQDWDCRIVRIHDETVIMTAFRYNYDRHCLEVDEAWVYNHPDYKPMEMTRALIILILGVALNLTGSMNVAFTRDIREDEETGEIKRKNWRDVIPKLSKEIQEEAKLGQGRVLRAVPKEIIELAESYGVVLKEAEKGRISHKEGVELFEKAFNLSKDARNRIYQLEKSGYLSRESFCFVLAANVWQEEEVEWLLRNASRPEALVLGADIPENRIFYADSLNWARAVILAMRFKGVILSQVTNGFSSEENELPYHILKPLPEEFWLFECEERFSLPWMPYTREKVWIEEGEKILLLSRPFLAMNKEESERWIRKGVEVLRRKKEKMGLKIACLLLNYEFVSKDFGQNTEEVERIAEDSRRQGIYVLFSYDLCHQMDVEIERKMRKARRIKKFPVREIPLKLRVIKVPKSEWEKPGGIQHVATDVIEYGKLITKGINIRRYREDFTVTSGCVERMALQNSESEIIAEIEGKESRNLIEVLKQKGIMRSFVLPEELSAFKDELKGKIKRALQNVFDAGIVIITVPYEKIETSFEPIEVLGKPFTIPKKIIQTVDKAIENEKYVSKKEQILDAHEQLRKALKEGSGLGVSYLQPQVFVETIREYIYYQKESFLLIFRKKIPSQRAELRIAYQDGTEGAPFPLFCLRKPKKMERNFYELPLQLISLRHMAADFATEACIIRNIEIQRRETSAEQEEFAFRKVYSFIENFLLLLRNEVSVEELEKEAKIFRVLWRNLKLEKEDKKQGLRVHLFQSSGLEPSVVGAYRAVLELLKKYQGKLVVVPRIYRPTRKLQDEFESLSDFEIERRRKVVSAIYCQAKEWC